MWFLYIYIYILLYVGEKHLEIFSLCYLFFSFLFQVILLVMSIKLMDQIRRKQDFMALLESNRYVPGAF